MVIPQYMKHKIYDLDLHVQPHFLLQYQHLHNINSCIMKIILRANLFLSSLTHRNQYPKTFYFGSKFTNAEEIFSVSISKAYENYSHFHQDHSQNLIPPRQRQSAKQLHLERSSLLTNRNQHQVVDDETGGKSQKHPKSGKGVKKQGKKEKRGEYQNKMQSSLVQEYPALNYLNQSFKVNMGEQMPGDNLLQDSYLSIEERDQNSMDFMKIIGHSMPIEASSKIIRMIESCCSSANEKNMFSGKNIGKRNLEELRAEVRDRKIFTNIKKKLEKELNNGQHGTAISASFINNLISSFREVNPFRITMQEFETCAPQPTPTDPSNHIDIQMTPENTTLKQCRHSLKKDCHKEEQSSKYAYIYQLPYNLSKNDALELITHLEQVKNVKIDSYMLFPYKSKFDFGIQEVSFRVPDNYEEEGSRIEKSYSSVNVQEFSKSKKGSKKVKGTPKSVDSDHMPISHSASEKMLAKMKQECFLKYNKSYMVIKFSSIEDKQKVVTPSTRLFGMTYKTLENIRLEEANQKTTLILSGIPVGCTTRNLIHTLNQVLNKHNIPIQEPEESYFSTQEVNLQFQYFTEALKALELLNNLEFQGRKLKVQIKYGSIKKHKGEYVQEPEQNVEIVRKIMDVREDYYRIFEGLDEDEKV